ncbi:MAG: hypothetical protein WD876_00510 [Candidatus Pacearchaeota archaeon]
MLVWIFTVLDLLTLLIASLTHFSIFSSTYLLTTAGAYLIIKLVIFRDVMSGIDAVFGVYLILMAFFAMPSFMYYIMMGWFLYKFVSTF